MTRIWKRRARARRPDRARLPLRGVTVVLLLALAGTATGSSWAPPARAATCELPAAGASGRAFDAVKASEPSPQAETIIQVEEEATPATPLPAATPGAATPGPASADSLAALTDELTAVSEALAECLSAGDAETVVQLAGERYLGQLFGSSVPLPKAEYVAIAAQLTPVPTRIVSVAEVTRRDEDRATAIVTQVVGNQLMQAEWTFQQAPRGERQPGRSPWQLAGERQLPAPARAGAAAIDVEIDKRAFALDETAVTGPDIVLRGDNVSAEDHEMLVLRLAPGFTTADLLRAAGPDLPDDAAFVGELPVPAGKERDLVLVDMPPGTYTLVCLFPDAEGTPHLAQGMEAMFTVT